MNKLCFFHYNCWDGMGAAWSVWKHAPDFTFFPIDYDNDMNLPEGIEDAIVMVVDFSFQPELMDRIIQQAHSFTLLDHHPRTHEYIRELLKSGRYKAWGYELAHYHYDAEWIEIILSVADGEGRRNKVHLEYDKHRSGAQMTWEHMAGSSYRTPPIIAHMSDYDRWAFDLPETKAVMTGLGQYDIDLEVYKTFMDEPDLVKRLVSEAPALERLRASLVNNVIQTTMRLRKIGDQMVPVINCPKTLTSQALQLLSKDYPFAVGYYDTPTHRKFSLRSRKPDGYCVREIAMLYGGNGHDHAAGMNIPFSSSDPVQRYLLDL